MVKFNKESVSLLQKKLSKKFSHKIIVRDGELLDSAIESVYQTFAGHDLYPTIEEKGARIGFNIINNHPFIDGNKRIGILAMLCFLEVNGVEMKYSSEDLINIGLMVASGRANYKQLLSWVNCHKITTKTQSDYEK